MILAADDLKVDFGCSPLDIYCKAFDFVGNGLASSIGWLADGALGNQKFAPGTGLWDSAISEAGPWLGIAVLVMVITSVVGIAGGAIMGRSDMIKRAVVMSLVSFPATMFAYFIVGEGLLVIDEISAGLLERLTGSQDGFGGVIRALFKSDSAHILGTVAQGAPSMIGKMILVLVALFLGVLVIALAMAFRDFVLMLLIAFAPLAFVLLPAKGGGTWVRRWVSAVTAMALAKPLILGTLILVMSALGKVDTIWSAEGVSLMIGFLIAAFMPIMAYSFFSFMGGGAGGDQVGTQAGQVAARSSQQVTHAATNAARVGITKGAGGGSSSGGSKTTTVKAPAQGQPAAAAAGATVSKATSAAKEATQNTTKPGAQTTATPTKPAPAPPPSSPPQQRPPQAPPQPPPVKK